MNSKQGCVQRRGGRNWLDFVRLVAGDRLEIHDFKKRIVFAVVSKEITLGILWIVSGILWIEFYWSMYSRI
jgi:hypothetical protein